LRGNAKVEQYGSTVKFTLDLTKQGRERCGSPVLLTRQARRPKEDEDEISRETFPLSCKTRIKNRSKSFPHPHTTKIRSVKDLRTCHQCLKDNKDREKLKQMELSTLPKR